MELFLAYLLAVLLVGTFPVGIGYWIYKRGRGRPTLYFTGLLCVIALMTGGLALELVIRDRARVECRCRTGHRRERPRRERGRHD